MFILGHIGIGRTVTRPWSLRLPILPFVVGALLPDLIDKPLFYSHLFSSITCTRTVAHTGLFAAAVCGIALVRRSPVAFAVALGFVSHLLLDCVSDIRSHDPHSAIVAFGWPFVYHSFAVAPFRSPIEHARHLWNMPVLVTELIGLALIAWEYVARQRRSAVHTPRVVTTRGTTDT